MGVKNIVKELNKLNLKDKLLIASKTYDVTEKFCRPEKMSIMDYMNEFGRLFNKTKKEIWFCNVPWHISLQAVEICKYGSTMSPDILAYRLLISVNAKDTQE